MKAEKRLEAGEEAKLEGEEESLMSTMAGVFDLEKHFTFYGSYHSNKWNIVIQNDSCLTSFLHDIDSHAYLPTQAPHFQQHVVLNLIFIVAAVYAVYYVALDKKAGCVAASLFLGCWVEANFVRKALPWSTSWKILLASQLVCWAGQIFGHQKLEFLQTFGYVPYPGSKKKGEKNGDETIREYRASD